MLLLVKVGEENFMRVCGVGVTKRDNQKRHENLLRLHDDAGIPIPRLYPKRIKCLPRIERFADGDAALRDCKVNDKRLAHGMNGECRGADDDQDGEENISENGGCYSSGK